MAVPAYAWEAASPALVEAFGLPAVASQKASRVALQEHLLGHAAFPVPSAAAYRAACYAWEVVGLPAAYGEAEGIAVLSCRKAACPAVTAEEKVAPCPAGIAEGKVVACRVEAGIVEPYRAAAAGMAAACRFVMGKADSCPARLAAGKVAASPAATAAEKVAAYPSCPALPYRRVRQTDPGPAYRVACRRASPAWETRRVAGMSRGRRVFRLCPAVCPGVITAWAETRLSSWV